MFDMLDTKNPCNYWFADTDHEWLSRETMIATLLIRKYCPVVDEFVKTSLDTIPFFLVWLIGLIFWFFLDLTNHSAHFFNEKHSPNFQQYKHLSLANSTLVVYSKTTKDRFLQIYYNILF